MSFAARRPVLAAAGLIALLVGLVASFPARVALNWFAPPQLQAWGVSGTIWHGSAADLALSGQALGALSWDARLAGMLALRPTWDFALRRPDGFAEARVGFSLDGQRQQIGNLEAAIDLGSLPPALVPDGVAGQLRASIEHLALDNGWPMQIAGRAAVAQLKLPGVIMPLGPFSFSFPDEADAPAVEIVSTGGPLAVDGQVELPERGQWRFSAELAPGEDPPRELVEGLAFVGEDLGGGRRRLVMSSEP